eukprot:RCo015428
MSAVTFPTFPSRDVETGLPALPSSLPSSASASLSSLLGVSRCPNIQCSPFPFRRTHRSNPPSPSSSSPDLDNSTPPPDLHRSHLLLRDILRLVMSFLIPASLLGPDDPNLRLPDAVQQLQVLEKVCGAFYAVGRSLWADLALGLPLPSKRWSRPLTIEEGVVAPAQTSQDGPEQPTFPFRAGSPWRRVTQLRCIRQRPVLWSSVLALLLVNFLVLGAVFYSVFPSPGPTVDECHQQALRCEQLTVFQGPAQETNPASERSPGCMTALSRCLNASATASWDHSDKIWVPFLGVQVGGGLGLTAVEVLLVLGLLRAAQAPLSLRKTWRARRVRSFAVRLGASTGLNVLQPLERPKLKLTVELLLGCKRKVVDTACKMRELHPETVLAQHGVAPSLP